MRKFALTSKSKWMLKSNIIKAPIFGKTQPIEGPSLAFGGNAQKQGKVRKV